MRDFSEDYLDNKYVKSHKRVSTYAELCKAEETLAWFCLLDFKADEEDMAYVWLSITQEELMGIE